jgi:hypothetical protein
VTFSPKPLLAHSEKYLHFLRDVLTQAAFSPFRKISTFFVESIKFVDFYGWMHFRKDSEASGEALSCQNKR